jgi:hypothetical protein
MRKKSVFKPTKQIIYLGNIIDSSSMTVKLPEDKIKRIIEECHALIKKSKATIRLVSRVIGLLVSSFSAVEYGPLHYRNLEMNKIDALKLSAGKFDAEMNITFNMKVDLRWWLDNLSFQKRVIHHGNPDVSITTDASLLGWGAVYDQIKIQGRWNKEEQDLHITILELLAIFISTISFCKNMSNIHIKIFFRQF